KRANQAIDREETAEQAAEEAHAELKHAHAALARIRQMADHWEQHLPEVIRTPAVVSALRAALDRVSSAVVAPPTDQTAPSHRAGLRDRIAAAIWERQNPGRRWADCEYRWRADAEADTDAVLAVLYREWPWLRAETEDAAPTDQTALRDRIAEALMRWTERGNSPQYAAMRRPETVQANAYSRADAVLAVLPTTDRAAVLREAIDVARDEGHRLEEEVGIEAARGARCVAYLLRKRLAKEQPLRRLADQAQPEPGARHV